MSHFGRSGPPDIRDTYSLLVLNISFRTTADDLFPLFDRYGKVVDVFIPRDRRTGDSRGFAFVRYKYADEAQKAVDKLDGKFNYIFIAPFFIKKLVLISVVVRLKLVILPEKFLILALVLLIGRNVDGRNIMVQFAKYGPNAEPVHKGRIVEVLPRTRGRSRSRSPRPRYRDGYRDKVYRRRSRSRSRERHERDRYRERERDYRRRSRSRSLSPDYYRGHGRRSDGDRRRSRSRSFDSVSPDRHSYSPRRSPTPHRTPPRDKSPDKGNHGERSPPSRSVSPRGRRADSRSPSPHSSDQD
ncbi:serine/arginine-rich splicing factor SC35-like isoform X1 [Phoenix dactylifera]|uniref:Serine/arginine-rich splicing factor SC35-like isoform X1 n=1 Tax=Phoenix dactylifera TaxID=42345 RepID=A0A8B9ATP6_PHODC|nr:serine/arginine-rich splicing factor SC35-like isoform X1 [Phoenix dactylifera]